MALEIKEIPLKGRLRSPLDDPSMVSPSDFQTLTNLRYTDNNPRGVLGMSKINSTALANPKIKNAIHYRKDFPVSESHIIVGAQDANGANPKIYRNDTAIPSAGDFNATALFTETSGGNIPKFEVGPDGKLVATNGIDTLIWGGNEFPVSRILDWDATVNSYKYDWTDQLVNSKTDANNLATLHRYSDTADANTMLLLHLDNNVTDSSPTTPHTVTNNNVTFSSSIKKFGTYSASFNGTNSDLSIPDNADFDFSGGTWTLEFWIYKQAGSSLPTGTYYYQQTDANNYFKVSYLGGYVTLSIYSASSEVVNLTSQVQWTSGAPAQWVRLTLVENGDNWYLFVGGMLVKHITDTDRAANYTGSVYIGSQAGSSYVTQTYFDEIRISNSARWTSNFSLPTSAYGTGNLTDLYIAATIPLSAIKFYVGTANTGAGTAAVYYWNGSSWASVGTVTDGTASGGVPLAQTGSMSFSSTASTAKQKIIDDLLFYWYKIQITEVDTTTTLSQVTLTADMQGLKDLWDGEYRKAASFQVFRNSTYNDFTTNVFEDAFDATNEATFAKLGGFTFSTDALYIGSYERLSGVQVGIVGGFVNTNQCTATSYYWDGSAWVSLSTDDQTNYGGVSFSRSGSIVWDSPAVTSEHQTKLSGISGKSNVLTPTDVPDSDLYRVFRDRFVTNAFGPGGPTSSETSKVNLYYYKITFTGNGSTTAFPVEATSTGVHVFFLGGIPAQVDVRGYEVPVTHISRLFLLGNRDAEPDAWLASSLNSSQVFNGKDTIKSYFGDGLKPVAAASLVSRSGATSQSILIVPNKRRTFAIFGDTLDGLNVKCISEEDGCTSPLTMKVVSIPDLAIPGRGKQVAIWQSQRGLVMSDGTAPILLSNDIRDKFDPSHSNYIGTSALATCSGWVDSVYSEYHWIVAGTQEWAVDLTRFRDNALPWFKIDRGSGNYLNGGLSVTDSNGVGYSYGYGDTGYLWRLENGTAFDGTAIAHTIRIADSAIQDNFISIETMFRGAKLIQVAKNTTANSVTITHFGDSATSGKTVGTISPAASGKRLDDTTITLRLGNYIFHSLQASISTNDETVGFEPLMLGLLYEVARIDIR